MTRLLALGSFLFLCAPVAADDWPQWLGPNATASGVGRRAGQIEIVPHFDP